MIRIILISILVFVSKIIFAQGIDPNQIQPSPYKNGILRAVEKVYNEWARDTVYYYKHDSLSTSDTSGYNLIFRRSHDTIFIKDGANELYVTLPDTAQDVFQDSLDWDNVGDSLSLKYGEGVYYQPRIFTMEDYGNTQEIPNPRKYDMFIEDPTQMPASWYYYNGSFWVYLSQDLDRYNEGEITFESNGVDTVAIISNTNLGSKNNVIGGFGIDLNKTPLVDDMIFSADSTTLATRFDIDKMITPVFSDNAATYFNNPDSTFLHIILGDSKSSEPVRGIRQYKDLIIEDRGSDAGAGWGNFSQTPPSWMWYIKSGTTVNYSDSTSMIHKSLTLATNDYYELQRGTFEKKSEFSKITYWINEDSIGTLQVLLDGVPYDTIITDGEGVKKVEYNITLGLHLLRFKCLSGSVILTDYILEKEGKTFIWNIARPGVNSWGFYQAIDSDWQRIASYKPNLITIRLGANDKYAYNAGSYYVYLKRVIDSIRTNFPMVSLHLCTVELSNDFTFPLVSPIEDYNYQIYKLAREYSCQVIDIYNLWYDWQRMDSLGLADDNIHESAKGGDIIGQLYYKTVKYPSHVPQIVQGDLNLKQDVITNPVTGVGEQYRGVFWQTSHIIESPTGNTLLWNPYLQFPSFTGSNKTVAGFGTNTHTAYPWFTFNDRWGYLNMSWFARYNGSGFIKTMPLGNRAANFNNESGAFKFMTPEFDVDSGEVINFITRVQIDSTGEVLIKDLSGVNDRMVIANPFGILKTQSIPATVPDSTFIYEGYGINAPESPVNTYTVTADTFELATPYDLSLKQNALTNPVTGTGSANFGMWWNGLTTAYSPTNNNLLWNTITENTALTGTNKTVLNIGNNASSTYPWFTISDASGYINMGWFSRYNGTDWIKTYDNTIAGYRITAESSGIRLFHSSTAGLGEVVTWTDMLRANSTGVTLSSLAGSGSSLTKVNANGLFSRASAGSDYLVTETDPIFAADSSKLLHWADTLTSPVGIASQNDLSIATHWTKSSNTIYPKSSSDSVAIGSYSASRTLDVYGDVIISDLTTTNPDKLVGADANGVLSGVTLGTNLSFTGTTLNATGGTITVDKDLVTSTPLSGGQDNILVGTDSDVTIGLKAKVYEFAVANDSLVLSRNATLTNNALLANHATIGSTGILFEGSSADGNETLLTATNPTADRTIYLPNAGTNSYLTSYTSGTANFIPKLVDNTNFQFTNSIISESSNTITATSSISDLNILTIGRQFNYLNQSSYSNTGYSMHYFNRYRGSLSTPSVVTSGDILGTLSYTGYDGTNLSEAARVDVKASGTISTGIVPSTYEIYTKTTTNGWNPRIAINNTGGITMSSLAGTGSALTKVDANGLFSRASSGTDYDPSITNEIQNLSYTASSRVLAIDGTGSTDATLPLFTSTEAGLVPLSGGGTTNFLRADGTWAPAGGSVTTGNLTESITGLQFDNTRQVIGGAAALSLTTGYVIPTATEQTNWNTAYTDRMKWDGGATGLVASTGRTSLGATTVGSNMFTLANPSAITFPRFNADNTVSALSASDFRTAIGAGTGNGTVTGTGVATYVPRWTGTNTLSYFGNFTMTDDATNIDLNTPGRNLRFNTAGANVMFPGIADASSTKVAMIGQSTGQLYASAALYYNATEYGVQSLSGLPLVLNKAGNNVGVGKLPSVYFDVNGAGSFVGDVKANATGSGFTHSAFWGYSTSYYRGIGMYYSGASSTWYTGNPYPNQSKYWGVYFKATANDAQTAQEAYNLMRIDSLGNVQIKKLDTDLTAPTTTGKKNVLISDASGNMSFRTSAPITRATNLSETTTTAATWTKINFTSITFEIDTNEMKLSLTGDTINIKQPGVYEIAFNAFAYMSTDVTPQILKIRVVKGFPDAVADVFQWEKKINYNLRENINFIDALNISSVDDLEFQYYWDSGATNCKIDDIVMTIKRL